MKYFVLQARHCKVDKDFQGVGRISMYFAGGIVVALFYFFISFIFLKKIFLFYINVCRNVLRESHICCRLASEEERA